MCPSKETPRIWKKACSGIKYSSGEVTVPTTCVGRETHELVNVAAAFSSYGNSMLPTPHIWAMLCVLSVLSIQGLARFYLGSAATSTF